MEDNEKAKHGVKVNLKWIIIAVVAIVVLIVIAISVKTANSHKEKEAIKLLSKVHSDAITGGAECEDVGNLINQIWHNAIYKEEDPTTDIYTRYLNGAGGFMDFNAALSNYFSAGNYAKKIGTAKEYEGFIENTLKKLRNIPKKLSEQYTASKKIRSAYKELYNIVDNPTGNIGTFSDSLHEADKNLSNACDDLNYLLEDIKN